jgi:competence protein ComEC
MPLVLALVTWGSIVLWVFFPGWWVWLPLLIAIFVWVKISEATTKRILVALALPTLVLAISTASLRSNDALKRAAESFSRQQLVLSVEKHDSGFLDAKVSSPKRFIGSGVLLVPASMNAKPCQLQTWKGTFLLTPPTGKSTPLTQFSARPAGKIHISCQGGLGAWIQDLGAMARSRIRTATLGITPAAKSLVLGVTDGDTSLLPKDLQDQFKALSLTHLNAVSGTNCSIVIALFLATFARFGAGKVFRVVASGLGLCLYLILVGNQPSVLRAALMGAVALFGLAVANRFSARNALAIAILLLLGCQPSYAVDYGFVLSVLATLGVLELAPRLAQWFDRWLPSYLGLILAVAIAAQLTCLPVLVLLQPAFGTFSVLANILAEPAVPVITVLGVIGALFAVLGLALPAMALFWVASFPAQYLVALANTLSAAGGTVDIPAGVSGVTVTLGLLLAVVALTSKRWQKLGVAVLIAAMAFTSVVALRSTLEERGFAASDWFYVSCDVGQGDATVIRSGTHVAVIDVGREPKPIDQCLKRLGINHIELLVLTHFDLDHVGGVAGALSGRKVDSAILTSFVDQRPGAFATQQVLEQAKISVFYGEKGLEGRLGDFNWLVLSPHHAGADSDDSNDGSVTMYWVSNKMRIITLADLGAKGQMRLAQERAQWWDPQMQKLPLILKVSHHGSADQYPEFIEWLNPTLATVSVGAGNTYGHPTEVTLNLLKTCSQIILRTDLQGSISLGFDSAGRLIWGSSRGG